MRSETVELTTDSRDTSTRSCSRRPAPATRSASHSAGTDALCDGRQSVERELPAMDARIASRAQPSAARSSSSLTRPSGRQGETRTAQSASDIHMFPIPATRCWSCSASPSARPGSARLNLDTSALGLCPVGEEIRAETPQRSLLQSEHGPVPLRRLEPACLEDEPRSSNLTCARRGRPATARSGAGGCAP